IYDGFIWGGIAIIAILLLFILEYLHISLPISPINNELFLRVYSLVGLVVVMMLLVYFFERTRLQAREELNNTNVKLNLAVKKAEDLAQKAEMANRLKSE